MAGNGVSTIFGIDIEEHNSFFLIKVAVGGEAIIFFLPKKAIVFFPSKWRSMEQIYFLKKKVVLIPS
jgi:hypothetical protein